MIVERQGANGCLLSTIAALSGVSLSAVEGYAKGLICEPSSKDTMIRGIPLKNFNYAEINDPVVFWGLIAHTAKNFSIPLEVLMPPNEKQLSNEGYPRPQLPRKGRGAVIFAIYSYVGECRHVCPFDNGMVFDPEATDDIRNTGESLSIYLERMRSEPWVREIRVTHIGVL